MLYVIIFFGKFITCFDNIELNFLDSLWNNYYIFAVSFYNCDFLCLSMVRLQQHAFVWKSPIAFFQARRATLLCSPNFKRTATCLINCHTTIYQTICSLLVVLFFKLSVHFRKLILARCVVFVVVLSKIVIIVNFFQSLACINEQAISYLIFVSLWRLFLISLPNSLIWRDPFF